MPKLRNDEEEVVAHAGDHQTSVNDDAHLREQDQAIAQLSAQLADMAGPVWESKELSIGWDGPSGSTPTTEDVLLPNPRPRTPLERLSRMLSLMSGQVAVAGEFRANSAEGNAHRVQLGSRVVLWCRSREVMRTATIEANERTRERLLRVRTRVLRAAASATRRQPEDWSTCQFAVYASAQLAVFMPSVETADELVADLNDIMERIIAPVRKSVEEELLRAIEAQP